MKKYIADFIRRGTVSCGLGPIILAILYMILNQWGVLETLSVNQACTGILSLSALAFIAGGMNTLYQIEQLPLMVAILIHGAVLYLSYLATYLINGWLDQGIAPVLVFSGIFVVGYLVIWAIIYWIIKKNTDQVNEMMAKKNSTCE